MYSFARAAITNTTLWWLEPGVPDLQDLMPDDLRWRWCNNDRNKIHNKCNVLESSPNHLPTPVCGKVVFHETCPWCLKGWGTAGLNNRNVFFFSQFWRLESRVTVLTGLVSPDTSLLVLQAGPFKLCPHMLSPHCLSVPSVSFYLNYLFLIGE